MIIELTKTNLIYIAFRRKKVILTTLSMIVLLSIFYCVVATPLYKAKATLVVNFSALPSVIPGNQNSQNAPTVTPIDHEEIINTNILELKSEQLAREVISEIGVDKLYPKHFSFNPLSYLFAGINAVFSSDKQAGGEQEVAIERAVDRFIKKDLDVRGEPRSNIIYLSVLNHDRSLAVAATRKLIDHFLEHEAATARNSRLSFIQAQLEIYQKQASDAQGALQEIKASRKIFSLEEERTALIQERVLVEESLLGVHNHLVESRERNDSLAQRLKQLSPFVISTQNDRDPLELSARSNLADLEAREAKLLNSYSQDSETVVDIRERIASAQKILDGLGSATPLTHSDPNVAYQQLEISSAQAYADMVAARTSEQSQQAQLETINQRLLERSADESAYLDAMRANDLADQNYRAYLQGVQQARVSEDLNREKITSIAVFDSVFAATKPASPKVLLILIFGLLGGLVFGLLFALIAESFDETFSTPVQVTAMLDLPVVGSMESI